VIDPRDTRAVLAPAWTPAAEADARSPRPMQFSVARMSLTLHLDPPCNQLTPEHDALQRPLKRFIDRDINPFVDEWEAAEIFPAHQVFKGMGDLGLLGLTSRWSTAAGPGLQLRRGVCRGAGPTSTAAACPWPSACRPTWPRPRWRASAAMSCARVPGAGHQPATRWPAWACRRSARARRGQHQDHARKDGDDYVINGGKMWITNSTQADWMLRAGQHQRRRGHKNKTLIMRADGPKTPRASSVRASSRRPA
jgi:citronellyl-CoA dehydrogenase